MGTINRITIVIKLLEIPQSKYLKKTLVTHARVQLAQRRQNTISHLVLWGKSLNDLMSYYKVNDYLLVEGYLSLSLQSNKVTKQIRITGLRVYPIALNEETYLER